MLRAPLRVGVATAMVCAALASVDARQSQQPPVYRAGAVLVPIDVRVLDRNGRMVTDLKASDFTILEDGVPQQIAHFAAQSLMPAEATGRVAARQSSFGTEVAQQDRRVFLIVLGRGRLQEPSNGIDAIQRFVRELLLPQDEVAILAWDRATDFTTDHALILRVLDRFKARHGGIEQMLKSRFSGLAAVYGGRDLPKDIRAEVNRVFQDTDSPEGTREVPAAAIANENRIASDNRQTADLLLGAAKSAVAGAAEVDTMSLTFDDFVTTSRQSMQDVGNLYTGIEYLRRLEGEKHLVFVTERGISLPRLDDDLSLASVASDARVAIDTIQTGGVSGTMTNNGRGVLTVGPTARETDAILTLRNVSQLTGGHVSVYSQAADAVDTINRMTRFSYLIGYSPTNTAWSAAYRRITVKINRPDVSVSYRHGYYGQPQITSLDHRQLVTTSRIGAAASVREDIKDIRIEATATFNRQSNSGPSVLIDARIAGARLKFADRQDQHIATLAMAFACLGPSQNVISQTAFEIELPFNHAQYLEARQDGIPYLQRVPVKSEPQSVKIVVYDYAADLVGTLTVRVR